MTTYYALTTTSGDYTHGRVLVVGNDRRQVEDAAEKLLLGPAGRRRVGDIWQDTELKNLRVFTRTELRRKLRWSVEFIFGQQYDALLPEAVDDHLLGEAERFAELVREDSL